MHLTIMHAILLSVFIALLMVENYGYGYWMISRPIFAGPLLGLIMGDLGTGLAVGASVELIFMGVLPIGGSVPPNAQIAGLLGTAFAILSGGKPEVGIALALPIGILAQFLIMLGWNFNIFLVHRADKHLQQGEIKKAERTHLGGLLVFFIVFFIPTFLAIYFGSDLVKQVVNSIPKSLMDGLTVASGLLPAIGMAMLLKMMNFRKFWPFFLIGFVLAVYLKLDVLAVALLGVGIAAAIYTISKKDGSELENVSAASETLNESKDQPLLGRKDLLRTFWRSLFSMTSINYERYISLGFCYTMIPALRKFYKDKGELQEAITRHNEFFNCHPYTANAVIGVALAMEEQKAKGGPITGDVISASKAALMGPLSGIGDSVFKATFMTVFASIGAALAMDGNWLGPIIFIVPNLLLNVLSRYYFISYGYKLGMNLIVKMKQSDVIGKFVQGTTIVGLMVTGAMIFNFVKVPIQASWTFGGKKMVLQDLLDKILPGMLPLLLALLFYWMVRRFKYGIYYAIILCFVLGIAGKLLHIF
ncbi:PTS system mannose/fructose/sorbose family transporter subunit IID [Camelliibacillus cellulosilyticus]|uniref:PTS system mannose/fructose/sorbose family transporter subunit IID n=1 Tax=Camelliibacillus cellulosilyticus TaxID=2174486 RepID=A0ABV9GPW3_9BACL